MEQRVLLFGTKIFCRLQLLNVDAIERPAMGGGVRAELVGGLGERDVHARLAAPDSFEQELETKRGLSGAGMPFHQMRSMGGETSTEKVIKTWHARRDLFRRLGRDTR